MHSDIAALASSLLETAGGVESFFASKSQASANSVAPMSPSPGSPGAGLSEGLREAIRRSVQVSCEKPPPPPSPGGLEEVAGGDATNSGKKKRKRGPISERAREANRRNPKKSTGPKTDEGKVSSALNAFQHGVYAEAAVLPGESELELEFLTAELAEDYQPRGAIEKLLLGRLASIVWRIRRLSLAEMDVGYGKQFRRREIFDEQIELMKILPQAKPPKSMPDEESQGYEIFADDFRENGKPGKLQQITHLEMKLTGQMLAVTRQLVQMKKLRIAEAKAGLGEDVREVERTAGNAGVPAGHVQPQADEDVGVPAKRNEAIRTPATQPQSGGSTIAWGASPRKTRASNPSPEGATQDDAIVEDPKPSESLLQSSDIAANQPAVARRPAAAAAPQAMVEASRCDCDSAARNEAIRDLADRVDIDVRPLTPAAPCEYGGEGVENPARNEAIRLPQ